MPITGVYVAGNRPVAGSPVARWGDLYGISPDPDGKSAWGVIETPQSTTALSTESVVNLLSTVADGPPAPDFSVSASPASISVQSGSSGSTQITVMGTNNFNSATS